MRKTAIFVEGQTELVFVREYLLRYFEYQDVDLQCRTLFSDGKFQSTEYDWPNKGASFHFQLINVGGDTVVLSRLLKLEKWLWRGGYDRIVGLRDMFSEEYLKMSKTIDNTINLKFIEGANKTIKKQATHPGKVFFCFAIMEIEAWMIGLHEVLLKINKDFNIEEIKTKTGIDIKNDDPENGLFQPSTSLNVIYEMFGESYKKKKGDIEKFMNNSSKIDFEHLFKKPICSQFNIFHEAILGNS